MDTYTHELRCSICNVKTGEITVPESKVENIESISNRTFGIEDVRCDLHPA